MSGKKKKKKKNKSKKETKKIDLDWEKLYLSIKELGERQEETDKMLKETDRILKEVAKRQEETEKIIQELAKRQEEDRKQLAEFRKQVARITDSWGRFVEGMVEPAAVAYFRKKGFTPHVVSPRLKLSRNGKNAEYDLIIEDKEQKVVLVVSAKTQVSSQDVEELEEDIKSLSFFMEELKGYKVIGAIAGISFGKGADKFAYRRGFLILKVSEESFQIIEPKKLKFFKL